MSYLLKVSVCSLMLFSSVNTIKSYAQERPTIYIDDVNPSSNEAIKLTTTSVKSATVNEQWHRVFGQTWVRNVVQAVIYPFRPEKGQENGKAVVVIPGGGYLFVSIENEGFGVAKELAAAGYTAFVLKYRVNQTPKDVDGFRARMAATFGSLGKKPLAEFPAAVDDLALAISTIQDKAAIFNLDKNKISAIGFSAGARTLVRLLENKEQANLLNTVAFIYPPMSQSVKSGPRPPMFLAMATDDPLFKQDNLSFIQNWLKQSKNVDIHLFSSGGHGFGIASKGTTSDGWWANYLTWLNAQ